MLSWLASVDARAGDFSGSAQFAIAAQRLSLALLQYSEQSGVQITSPAELVEGLASPGVNGFLPAASALQQLLAGTGLSFRMIDRSTVSIFPAGDPASASRGPPTPRADGSDVPRAVAGDDAGPDRKLPEVIVTATRREELPSRVPISLSTLTQSGMDERGIKDANDIARFTPGVRISQSGTNTIAIRGISGTGGSSTTGIYIDEVPIQTRGVTNTSTDALPKIFDLERVEVLRGPQGTLFGAGSEGGTLRYITVQPSLAGSSAYAKAEMSFTRGGEPSYEAGLAGGTPILEGVLGIRAAAWIRRDGGWIDRVDPTTYAEADRNANRNRTSLLRASAVWAPGAGWTVTPAVYYQESQINDAGIFWPILSRPARDAYVSANPDQSRFRDRFVLPSLKVEGELGFARLIFNASYFDRSESNPNFDATIYNLGFYQTLFGRHDSAGAFLPPFPLIDANGIHLPPGLTDYRSPAGELDTQRNLTHEVRLQSADPSARLVWTTGIFVTYNKQTALTYQDDPQLERFTEQIAGLTEREAFGVPLTPEGWDWMSNTKSRDKQRAWFGEATLKLGERWHVTGGARYSRNEFAFDLYTAGPQLFGPPATASPEQKETSLTPKLSISYQHETDNLYYFTYARGFRPGGGNAPIPFAACSADFQDFGIAGAPLSYHSDKTDSYEIGTKNMLGGKVRLASSAFYIRWSGIQQQVMLPTCALSFISNLGTAVAKGADLQAEIDLTRGLTMQLALGYTDARYSRDSRLSSLQLTPVAARGDAIEGADGRPGSPLAGSISAEYRRRAGLHDLYLRGDYEFQTRSRWPGPSQDPGTLQFNASNFTLPATHLLSLRGGVEIGGWDVSMFVDNVTDAHPVRNYDFSIDSGNGTPLLERNTTFRPRTAGVTLVYRN